MWYFIEANGHNIEGTYPYVITSFIDNASFEAFKNSYENAIVTHIDISNAPTHDVEYNGEIFECSYFDEAKALYVVCKEWGYPVRDIITTEHLDF